MPELVANLSSSTIRLLGVEPPKAEGLRSWIEEGAYVPSNDPGTGNVNLGSVTTQEIAPFLSFDFTRFALASAESFLEARREWNSRHFMSWPLLKLYYSAFFAAHAIMRSQGSGVVKIERNQANKLGDFLQVLGEEHTAIAPGMYQHNLYGGSVGNSILQLNKHGDGQGVHAAFWKTFCEFLNRRANLAVQKGMVDAEEFLAGATEITIAIAGVEVGTGSWISDIRNQINYQHKHSVWFPPKRRQKERTFFENLRVNSSNCISLNMNHEKQPVLAFSKICYYLAMLNFDIAEYLAARSTKGGAFGQKWRRLRSILG